MVKTEFNIIYQIFQKTLTFCQKSAVYTFLFIFVLQYFAATCLTKVKITEYKNVLSLTFKINYLNINRCHN
jgi:hypothetical protein